MSGNRTVSAENKLKAVHEYLSGKGSLEYIAKKYGVTYTPFRKWIAKYKTFGDKAFLRPGSNQCYTLEFKESVVQDYLNDNSSLQELAIKYKIPSESTISNWVLKYNSSHNKLNAYTAGGKQTMTTGRKTTFEERIEIVKYCMDHNLDYKTTAKVYETTYANVFNWVKKFKEKGEDGLGDKRGRHKNDDEIDENEKLRRELKKMQHERDMALLEVKLLKKLDEIERRRYTERANMKRNMKQSKK